MKNRPWFASATAWSCPRCRTYTPRYGNTNWVVAVHSSVLLCRQLPWQYVSRIVTVRDFSKDRTVISGTRLLSFFVAIFWVHQCHTQTYHVPRRLFRAEASSLHLEGEVGRTQ